MYSIIKKEVTKPMGKFYTDKERFETVKHFKASGMSQSDYSKKYGYARTTLRDWVAAYNHINGDFIRVDNIGTTASVIEGENVRINVLDKEEIIRKSTHFSRFDHSVVVIESRRIKITTSLAQALEILKRIYD